MNSRSKNIAIAIVSVVVLLAIFSFKKYVLDAGNTDVARAVVDQKLHQAPASTDAPPPAQGLPATTGMHMPGNKH